MSDLGLEAVTSMRALNQWISVIDTNLVNSNRVAYKETRVSMDASYVNDIGRTTDRLSQNLQIPSSQLQLTSTKILDYEQGQITKTDTITEFALNGKGYFVVEDENGLRYATRDGTFNFNNEGILTTLQGLKVLSAGQDYIRSNINDNFYVNDQGISQGLSSYGDRELMVVDLYNSNDLYYSRYGYTTFELGSFIPMAFDNNFSMSMDGINPYLVDESYQSLYQHDLTTGSVFLNTTSDSEALLTAHDFTDFRNSIDFTIPVGSGFRSFGFSFLKGDETETLDQGGIAAVAYRTSGGADRIALVQGGAAPSIISDTVIAGGLTDGVEYRISLLVEDGIANLSIAESLNNIDLGSVSALVSRDDQVNPLLGVDKGFVSIGNLDGATLTTALGALSTVNPGDFLQINDIHIKEANKQPYYNISIRGGDAESLGSSVVQYALEQSTSSLSDQLPMLNQAQKVFSALSKVISVSNSRIDDMNSLIR